MNRLAPILQQYFTTYLVAQRAMSPATITTYRDTWRLFLAFLSDQTGLAAHTLELAHIDEPRVAAFLDYLEHERGNSIATRNLRLAAIKGVMTFHIINSPEHLDTVARIQAIPVKKQPKPQVAYLTATQTQALLGAIDTTTWPGRRDQAMFTLAVQTGLRISEISSLTIDSLSLGTPAHVGCTGKRRKRRTTPLTTDTASLLTRYLAERSTRSGHALFPNPAADRYPPTQSSTGCTSMPRKPQSPVLSSSIRTSPCTRSAIPPRCGSSMPASTPRSSPYGWATNPSPRQTSTFTPT